jgi:hypothetical protein
MLLKTVIDTGWYGQNRYLGTPRPGERTCGTTHARHPPLPLGIVVLKAPASDPRSQIVG